MEELDRRALLRRAGLVAGTGVLAGLAGCDPDPLGAPGRPPGRPAAPARGWAGVRAQFELDPGKRHFAAFVLASHPRPVAEAIEQHRRGLQADTDGYLEDHGQRLDRQARTAAAEYLGGDPGQVAFTRSTTDGLGLLYGGLRLRPGQEVVTTTHDFYATHEALRLRAERTGARAGGSPSTTTRRPSPPGGWSRPSGAGSARGPGCWPSPGSTRARGEAAPGRDLRGRGRAQPRPRPRRPGAGLRRRRPRPRRRARGRSRPRLRLPGRRLPQVAVRAQGHRPGLGPARRLGRGHRHRPQLLRGGPSAPGSRAGAGRAPLGPVRAGRLPRLRAPLGPGRGVPVPPGPGEAGGRRPHPGAGHPPQGRPGRRPGVRLVTPRDPELSAGIVCLEVAGRDPGEAVADLRRQGVLASATPYAQAVPAPGPEHRHLRGGRRRGRGRHPRLA